MIDRKSRNIVLFYLGQAGFRIDTGDGRTVFLDAYLSDAAERIFGFKRMTPSVLSADRIDADLYLSTHSHVDHLDPDTLPAVVRNPRTFFLGASDCGDIYRRHGISEDRFALLNEGEQYDLSWAKIRGVDAEHGELAPEAIGLLLEIDGVRIYHTGDTSFVPERIGASLASDIDILIAPINGRYGNMDAREAVELALLLKPRYVIASHFWTFLEHVGENGKGDPTTFLREAGRILAGTGIEAKVMAPGESLAFPDSTFCNIE